MNELSELNYGSLFHMTEINQTDQIMYVHKRKSEAMSVPTGRYEYCDITNVRCMKPLLLTER